MSDYKAPLEDMAFVLRDLLDIQRLESAAELDNDMLDALLTEAGRLAGEVLGPISHPGDMQGAQLKGDEVKTANGWKEAYAQYKDSGWNSVPFNPEYGGQGLPWALAFAIQEMWQSANTAFALCPMLTLAAVEALDIHGTQEQKDLYLEKLISGEWTGTMNLTEPQAGSDLASLRAKAVKQDDGSYKLSGEKIYITYGDHDMTDNIIHMVLARTPDAPEGVKGISLFLVPKFILDENGQPGEKNDVVATKLEEKLGIHASPTCVMKYGESGGATAFIIGNENEGLKYMFTMMNNARLTVGMQGIAVAERAYQHALAYAHERVQGKRIDSKDGNNVAIIDHPDVQRMLLSMKSQIQAARAMAYEAAMMMDKANEGDKNAHKLVDLMTPIVKSWGTEIACDVSSEGIQIHGGMGYIEEAGAAQYFRDARITPIYEGTNGIQAQDLCFRKILRDGGEAFRLWTDQAEDVLKELQGHNELQDLHAPLADALQSLKDSTDWILEKGKSDFAAVAAISVPYQTAFSITAGGFMMGRAALSVQKSDTANDNPGFAEDKILLTRFFTAHILPKAAASHHTVQNGDQFVRKTNSLKEAS